MARDYPCGVEEAIGMQDSVWRVNPPSAERSAASAGLNPMWARLQGLTPLATDLGPAGARKQPAERVTDPVSGGASQGTSTDSEPATEVPPGSRGSELELMGESGGLGSTGWRAGRARKPSSTSERERRSSNRPFVRNRVRVAFSRRSKHRPVAQRHRV
jgi:hypothetical protein